MQADTIMSLLRPNVLAHWRQAPGAVRAAKDNTAARSVTGAARRPVQRFVVRKFAHLPSYVHLKPAAPIVFFTF